MDVLRIPATRVRTLRWDGDDLVDVAGGWQRWRLDGETTRAPAAWSFAFDQIVVSPSGRFQALYVERGTKGVLVDGRTPTRELNRSYSHAGTFDYPIALGRLADGREVIAHCPDERNVIEVDELDSGRRLTGDARTPVDIFHARLAFSPSGRHLLAGGWVWQPYGLVCVFDLASFALDGEGVLPLAEAFDTEVDAACWLDDDRIAIAASCEDTPTDEAPEALQPGELGVWSLAAGRWLSRARIGRPSGILLPYGELVLALYGHPRLIDPATGAVLAEWPDVDTGHKTGYYGHSNKASPVVALDPVAARLAVAQADHIAVIDLRLR